MRNLSILFVVGLIAVLANGISFGTTYYVATNGSDNNPGTQAQPWATLQHAGDTMVAGDTTIVANGTYAGFREIETKSGTSGAPITMKAQNISGATLNTVPAGNKHNGVLELEGGWNTPTSPISYWVIDGFVVDGQNVARAIDTRITSHLTVQNCTAMNSKASSSSVATALYASFCDAPLIQNNIAHNGTEHGCYTCNSADNGTVRCNTWYSNTSLGHHMNGDKSMGGAGNITGDGQMTGWLMERNTSYSNGSSGYDADGVSSSTWKNNLAYNNIGKGLQMTQVDGASNPASDRIVNNTFCLPSSGYYCINFAKGKSKQGGTNNVIENNILYNAAGGIHGSLDYISGWMSTLTSDYNCVIDRFGLDDNKTGYTLATWRSTYSKDMHSVLGTDPNALFNNYAGNDFHLKAGSPAIDHGTTLTDVTDDHDGAARTGTYEIGCYVY